jgi:hypothetical protein
MLSQAGHDAYAVADLTPTAMIFTPCRDGISHNTNEDRACAHAAGRQPAVERGGAAGQPLADRKKPGRSDAPL